MERGDAFVPKSRGAHHHYCLEHLLPLIEADGGEEWRAFEEEGTNGCAQAVGISKPNVHTRRSLLLKIAKPAIENDGSNNS